jgi:hypothetical protein
MDASRWFEEILADATEIFVSHPETLESMAFDGFADEGDPKGWPAHAGAGIGLKNTETWELPAKRKHR